MNTNVYIDGFNLYYGLFKGQHRVPWKWLDVDALCKRVAAIQEIHRIRYFTADVTSPEDDPEMDFRQQTYLRALETIPYLTVHKGQFTSHRKREKLLNPIQPRASHMPRDPAIAAEVRRVLETITHVDILKTEEKGSDVSLASFLLFDAFRQDFDRAIVVSNDSDLATPITMVCSEFDLDVMVVNPHRGHTAVRLREVSTSQRQIRRIAVQESQFPNPVLDRDGSPIHQPARWIEQQATFTSNGR